jgi:hypothetical protein
MFASLKRRYILLIACGAAAVSIPLFFNFAPRNLDTGLRLLFGVRAFVAMTILVYF